MGTQGNDSLQQLIQQMGLKEGNQVLDSNGNAAAAANLSVPLYADAAGNLQAGGLPFALQLLAGVQNTSNSALAVEGSSTGSANELMHQTLVSASNVTTVTNQAFIRITLTDDAGNITNGAYYIPVATLS